MEKIVEVSPAFDKRDPDPNKNFGVHGCNLKFLLKGERGVVQFLIYTNWHLPHVTKDFERRDLGPSAWQPMAADVGYHSPVPMDEEQEPITEHCEYLDGKPCYYDGSGLYAEDVFQDMLREGDIAIWRHLEKYYVNHFGELI